MMTTKQNHTAWWPTGCPIFECPHNQDGLHLQSRCADFNSRRWRAIPQPIYYSCAGLCITRLLGATAAYINTYIITRLQCAVRWELPAPTTVSHTIQGMSFSVADGIYSDITQTTLKKH